MLATVQKSPAQLAWVLLAVVEGGRLGRQETDLLTIVADGATAVAGVDLEAGKVAQFGTHRVRFLSEGKWLISKGSTGLAVVSVSIWTHSNSSKSGATANLAPATIHIVELRVVDTPLVPSVAILATAPNIDG